MEKIKDIAKEFVLVRLARIDSIDLNHFEFDLDVTMMIFFLDAEGKIYSRYGGRDSENADNRQSLDGLRYTMQSVLNMHAKNQPLFAEPKDREPIYTRSFGFKRGCMHCHNAKEKIYNRLWDQGKWKREMIWRYPPPDNLGLELDVDRGNIVKKVKETSPAAKAGIKTGDSVTLLNKIPVHSFGDAQYALDRAPETGTVNITWQRAGQSMTAKLELPKHWRKTDITWRPSLYNQVPAMYMFGDNLSEAEKKKLGLSTKQTAFRLEDPVPLYAKKAGVLKNDIVIGVDGEETNMRMYDFLRHVRRQYIVGDQVSFNIIRNGKRVNVPVKLVR